MNHSSQTRTRDADISRSPLDRQRMNPFAWQKLDATSKLCLVEQALHPPAHLLDGYPPAL